MSPRSVRAPDPAPSRAMTPANDNQPRRRRAAGVCLMMGAVNWARDERFLACLVLLTGAWVVFGAVVVSRRILKAVFLPIRTASRYIRGRNGT
jgi:hypothetical protein